MRYTEEVHRIKLEIFLHILLLVLAKVSPQVSMSRLNVLPFPSRFLIILNLVHKRLIR